MTNARRVLDVRELAVRRGGVLELAGISFALDAGESLIVLGETGSGKDALVRVLGNFYERRDSATGTVEFGDGDARPAGRRVKGSIRISYLCSPRFAPLSPFAATVSQLARIVACRQVAAGSSGREELRIALERFAAAPSFASLDRKPQELKPVELAWALFASAMAQTPEVLIADHALSGLTPTEVETLGRALMDEQKRQGFALIYAAQGLQAAAHLRGRTIVLRRGKVIEEGDFDKLAAGQSHAYTKTLFKALPQFAPTAQTRSAQRGEPLLQVQGLDLSPRKRRNPKPRDGVTFELRRGAALAFVGEEGSGRHAHVRALLGLDRFTNGRVVLDQVDMSLLSSEMTSRLRRRIAFIAGADEVLDPRMTLWDTVDEPLRAHLRLPRDMIAGHRETALKRVGLASHDGHASVAALSAFDKRRLQVARAIVSTPFLAVIDEPLCGLDAFAQTIMLELLVDLRKQEGPAFLVITADLRIAQALADDIMIFKDGKVIERAPISDILCASKEAETKRLLAAAEPRRPLPPDCARPEDKLSQFPTAPTPFERDILGADEIAVVEASG